MIMVLAENAVLVARWISKPSLALHIIDVNTASKQGRWLRIMGIKEARMQRTL